MLRENESESKGEVKEKQKVGTCIPKELLVINQCYALDGDKLTIHMGGTHLIVYALYNMCFTTSVLAFV